MRIAVHTAVHLFLSFLKDHPPWITQDRPANFPPPLRRALSHQRRFFLPRQAFDRDFPQERRDPRPNFLPVDDRDRTPRSRVGRAFAAVMRRAPPVDVLGDAGVEGSIRAPEDVDVPPLAVGPGQGSFKRFRCGRRRARGACCGPRPLRDRSRRPVRIGFSARGPGRGPRVWPGPASGPRRRRPGRSAPG